MDSAGPDEELVAALEQLARHIRQVATAGGLSTASSSVLNRLRHEGPRRITELARAEGISQPAMTQMLTRLEREGLVRRIASTRDRRGVLVEVTGAGTSLVEQRRAERAAALRQMIDRLAPHERAAAATALPALAREIAARPPG
ncbi:MarR family winged helix-turn-helix transcriptional regulator [Actinomadura parmotrematis]|uniref:MarR family transcriptional regulator n=1 Tax=Actinomadura parmotrematis TaxID=2864039 RepID=A0ABS7FR57_9ACTN|nr:MarR family transcriptional regulator [Actinomadura parmotrematis]MBW8482710.1 MarR family transcriptional regulator [Actinomadura parmotrematis]